MLVNKDWMIEKNGHAGFLYADDVCLMENTEQDLITLVDALANMV